MNTIPPTDGDPRKGAAYSVTKMFQAIDAEAERKRAMLRTFVEAAPPGFDFSGVTVGNDRIDVIGDLDSLRTLRRLADGPILERSIFPYPYPDSRRAHVAFKLRVSQVLVWCHVDVADYTRLVPPGAACQVEPISLHVVCNGGAS